MDEQKQIVLFIDTETTGLNPTTDEVIQVWCILSEYCTETHSVSDLATINIEINPTCEEIHPKATEVHGKTKEMLKDKRWFKHYANFIFSILATADIIVGHNIKYDIGMLMWEFKRIGLPEKRIQQLQEKETQCTMQARTKLRWGRWPKLDVLHQELFNESFEWAHDAMADIVATKRIWVKMKEDDLI